MKSTRIRAVLKQAFRRMHQRRNLGQPLSTLKEKIQATVCEIPSNKFLMDCHIHTQASDSPFPAQAYYNIGKEVLGDRFLFTTTDHELLTQFSSVHLWGAELHCKMEKIYRMIGGYVHILAYFEEKPKINIRFNRLKPIEAIHQIQALEGIAIPAHIFAIEGTCDPEVLEACDAFELNAGFPGWINGKILQWAQTYKKPVIAGSDAHYLKHFFDGFTVFSQQTNLLDQIRKNKIRSFVKYSFDRLLPFFPLNLPFSMYKMIFKGNIL
ncbi:MAG: PHP domain-containing protein [Candidatus Hodarchaeota archaeon]